MLKKISIIMLTIMLSFTISTLGNVKVKRIDELSDRKVFGRMITKKQNEDWEYIYNLAIKYKRIDEKLANRYANVIIDECLRQNFYYPRRIARQTEKESQFKYNAVAYRIKSITTNHVTNITITGNGAMQQSRHVIHLLYWFAKNRDNISLKDKLKKIETETSFTRKDAKRINNLYFKKDKTEEEIKEYKMLREKANVYEELCQKEFRMIRRSIACGVRLMKELTIQKNYQLALLAYWAGANSKEYKYWKKEDRIHKNHYIKDIILF